MHCKLEGKRKSKAEESGVRIISGAEMEEARKVRLKRVQDQRNGDSKRIRLDDTTDVFLQDRLIRAGEKGYNSLAEKVLEMHDNGAVEVKRLLMGLFAGWL